MEKLDLFDFLIIFIKQLENIIIEELVNIVKIGEIEFELLLFEIILDLSKIIKEFEVEIIESMIEKNVLIDVKIELDIFQKLDKSLFKKVCGFVQLLIFMSGILSNIKNVI